MNEFIIPIIIFVALALFAGLLLSLASKLFAVKMDTRVTDAREALPGANCGACGYAGCDEYAAAVIRDEVSVSLCVPGGAETANKLGEITGRKADTATPPVARVRCNGGCNSAKKKYQYQGLASCAASATLYGGDKSCSYGCLGYGDCVKACPQNAIRVENGVAVVDSELCIGCLICVSVCPKGVIAAVDRSASYLIACQNPERGKETRAVCSVGCIGCKKCERNCPSGAVKVTDGLAVIDPALCTGCGVCAEGCPVKCIVRI